MPKQGLPDGLAYQPVPTLEEAYNPQAPMDRTGPGYSNDVSLKSWLRNGDATTKPGFDHTGKGNREKV